MSIDVHRSMDLEYRWTSMDIDGRRSLKNGSDLTILTPCERRDKLHAIISFLVKHWENMLLAGVYADDAKAKTCG